MVFQTYRWRGGRWNEQWASPTSIRNQRKANTSARRKRKCRLDGQASILLRNTKSRAAEYSLAHDLTKKYVLGLILDTGATEDQPGLCPALGRPFHQPGEEPSGAPHQMSMSVDQIIPRCGYLKGMVRIISFRANWIKGTARSYDEVIERHRNNDLPRDEVIAVARYVERSMAELAARRRAESARAVANLSRAIEHAQRTLADLQAADAALTSSSK